EEVVEIGNVVDLLDRRLDVVLDAAEAERVAVEQDIAGPPVAVARLADRADVDERLAGIELVGVVDLFRRMELVQVFGLALSENTGDVRMSLKAVFLDQGEDAVHLALVVDVLWEHVF